MAILGGLLEVTAEDFALLTEVRQKILVELLHKPMSLSALDKEIDEYSKSTIAKAKDKLISNDLIKKNQGDLYELTDRGKDLALVVAQPNGLSEEDLRIMLRDRIATKLEESMGTDRISAEKEANKLAQVLRDVESSLTIDEEQQDLQTA